MVDRIEQTLTDNRTSVKVKLRRPKTESTEHREKGITRGLNTEELQLMQHEGIQDKTKNQPFHLTRQGNIREAGIRIHRTQRLKYFLYSIMLQTRLGKQLLA